MGRAECIRFSFTVIESVEENCRISRQSLFLEKPLNVFDLNFELLHSTVVCLPGIFRFNVFYSERLYAFFVVEFIHNISPKVPVTKFLQYTYM